MSKNHRLLAMLLVAGLLLRGAFALRAPESFRMDPDSYSYDTIARTIVASGTLTPSAARTPGYPGFMAAVYSLAGERGIGGVVAVQTLLSTLTIWLAFLLGRRIYNERTGLAAAFLVALDPFQVYFTAKILTETLFTFLLCLVAYGLALMREDATHADAQAIAMGLLLGTASLVRPEVVGLALAIAGVHGTVTVMKTRNWRGIARMGMMTAAMLAVILPWGLRNQRLFGRCIVTSTNGGWTLYEGLARDYSVAGWDKYRKEHMAADVRKFGLDTELKINDHFAAKSRAYIRANPAEYAVLGVRKLFKMYRIVPYEVFSRKARLASVLYFMPLLVLFIAGIVLARDRAAKLLPLLIPIMFITGIHMLFTSQIRYRVPLQPLMAVVAAGALAALYRQYKSRRGAV